MSPNMVVDFARLSSSAAMVVQSKARNLDYSARHIIEEVGVLSTYASSWCAYLIVVEA